MAQRNEYQYIGILAGQGSVYAMITNRHKTVEHKIAIELEKWNKLSVN